jgi:Domain of unknown function (DUF6473)
MRHDSLGELSLNYAPCRYGNSRVFFRGPRQSLIGPYVAFVGGTETYGKFVENPFPGLIGDAAGVQAVNLGCVNASIEAFVQEPAVWTVCHDAVLNIVQVMDAHSLSNRFYAVHPRRNDRFLSASTVLQALYPEVDFTEFCFLRHMLTALHDVSRERFRIVCAELQAAWVARMKRFLAEIGPRTLLLWLSDHMPSDVPWNEREDAFGPAPLFVSRAMLDQLRPLVRGIAMVQPSVRAREAGVEGMVFGAGQAAAAALVPNLQTHREVADALLPHVRLAFSR